MVPLPAVLLRLPQHLAHGTSLAIVVFVATGGLAGYWLAGKVDWSLALWLTLGGVLGAYLGAIAMARPAQRSLQPIFGLFLLCGGRSHVHHIDRGSPAGTASARAAEGEQVT